jgi:hypothetical protein
LGNIPALNQLVFPFLHGPHYNEQKSSGQVLD